MDTSITKVVLIIGGILFILIGLLVWDKIDEFREKKRKQK